MKSFITEAAKPGRTLLGGWCVSLRTCATASVPLARSRMFGGSDDNALGATRASEQGTRGLEATPPTRSVCGMGGCALAPPRTLHPFGPKRMHGGPQTREKALHVTTRRGSQNYIHDAAFLLLNSDVLATLNNSLVERSHAIGKCDSRYCFKKDIPSVTTKLKTVTAKLR